LILNTSTYIQNFMGIEGHTVDTYGAAKQMLTQFLMEKSKVYGFRSLDLFLLTIYGIGDRPNHLVPSLISAARAKEGISLSEGNQLMNLMHINDIVNNFTNAIHTTNEFSYRRHFVWQEDYITVRALVGYIESVAKIKIDCLWGKRPYAGHEMFEPWNIPMTQIPQFESRVNLHQGLSELWSIS
jgi:nucleoside-diphosphate-sugar epimerase